MSQQKAGRNDPCPCGSGKKYKQCCLSKQPKGLARKFSAKVISSGGIHKPVQESASPEAHKAAVDYNTLMERSFGSAIHSNDEAPPLPKNPSDYIVEGESNQTS